MQALSGVVPSVEQLAELLGLEVERIVEARRAALTPLSIEAPVSEDSDVTRGDLLGDRSPGRRHSERSRSRSCRIG